MKDLRSEESKLSYNILSHYPKEIKVLKKVTPQYRDQNFSVFQNKDNFFVQKQDLLLPPIHQARVIDQNHYDEYMTAK